MNYRIAIVIGSFHKDEADEMLEEAYLFARENSIDIVEVRWVPGSMEKPFALKQVLQSQEIDGAVALGIIEKGETKHGLVMATSVMTAIIDLQLALMKPIGVGILGPDIHPSQIPTRVRPYARAAISAAYHMLRATENKR
jgi:6,7-dimethyl-8-ribityllumazine synthase